jgi:hypothetical protein
VVFLGVLLVGFVAGSAFWWWLMRRRVEAAWEANMTDVPFAELPPPPRARSRSGLPPPDPPGSPPVRLPISPLPMIDAALTAPRATTQTATRDLATAQVALLERCPGCGRPATGANSRQDEQGLRWHLDCRAAG